MYYQEALDRKERAEYIAEILEMNIEEVSEAADECRNYGIDLLGDSYGSYSKL